VKPKGSFLTPVGFDAVPFLKWSVDEIKNYTLGFVFETPTVASGTFINAQGKNGILTAHHVAKTVMKLEKFGLSIRDYMHEVWVVPDDFEHIPIGENPNESVNGPDLSFLRIRNTKLIGTIAARKSFYFLDSKDPSKPKDLLKCTHWFTSGCPDESKQDFSDDPQGPVLGVHEFIGAVTFKKRYKRNGFDFLKIELPTDNRWPDNCKGMSGGGLWLAPLECSPDDRKKIRHGAPILAGVNYYQTERILTAHGPDSIYRNVIQALSC
jgi:hypothetical protein